MSRHSSTTERARFADIDVVTGGNNNGLGPRFNANSCLTCHVQPAAGGSSPAENPLIAIATRNGAKNRAVQQVEGEERQDIINFLRSL